MNLRKKIFLFTAGLVAIVFVTAFVLVQRQVRSAMLQQAEHDLAETADAVLELALADGALGTALLGHEPGDPAVERFVGLTRTELVLLVHGRVMTSSLSPERTRQVAALAGGLTGEQRVVELAGETYLAGAQVLPIDVAGGRPIHVLLRSLGPADRLASRIIRGLLVVGLCAGVVAFAFAWMGARRITLPLRQLSQTISEMAETGQLRSNFASVGGDREVRLIEDTFRQLALSLEESQRARERSYVEAVGAVVAAADARDHETAGHSFRVAHYAVALARTLGIHGEPLKAIEWGSLLHDVGKMVVPDDILRKVGPLTEDEWHIMRQHPTWGYDMLAEVGFLKQAALDIVYSHHERWDGSGYPRGLAGEEIPLAARVFAVVDTYDAITSDRPYRRARSHQAAMAELQRVAGSQLDPRIVEAFRKLPDVELRRLREMCKRVHPGLRLPSELLDAMADPEAVSQRSAGEYRR